MPKPNFSILLASSQRKEEGGNPFAPDMFDYRSSGTFNFFKELNQKRQKLIDVVQQAIQKEEDLESVFGLKGESLDEAVKANTEIYNAPLMSAFDRYSPGRLYSSIDFQNLPTGAQRRLLENGIIFTGLFGILRPDDLIPNYRLRMDDEIPGMGRIYKFWRPHISPLLNRAVEGRWVWNLLPRMHRRAWDDEHTYERLVNVSFYKETKEGERSAVTQEVKELQGGLVNFIVEETVEDMESFREWEHPKGYALDEEASTFDDKEKVYSLVLVQKEGWEERRKERKRREKEERERKEREKAEKEKREKEEKEQAEKEKREKEQEEKEEA